MSAQTGQSPHGRAWTLSHFCKVISAKLLICESVWSTTEYVGHSKVLKNAVPLGNIDYESDGMVVLAVNTSWKAVGYYIYQEMADTKKKKTYVKFGSITLNEREARFSQPKRELFGLKRALETNEYLLIGCRKLVVETDAKYIHGMLNHPEMGPNATIN